MKITKGKVTEIIIKVDDSFLEQAKLKGMESKYELVRCKDCIHFCKARNEDEYDSCAILFEMQDIPLETGEDKYCSWAERETE